MNGPKRFQFVVAADDPRDRLDKLLVALLSQRGVSVSRSTVQRWIGAGAVTVEGHEGEASSAVRPGARVDVVRPEEEPSTAVPDPTVPFEVVYEDADLLVIDKPAGVVVHPARGHASGTLVNGLIARGSLRVEGVDRRPGIVHRIDKGTSGLLIVAKNDLARETLQGMFARHEMGRVYLAIVAGEATDATYDTLHGRHPSDRLRFTSRVTRGKRAVTHVRALERLAGGKATLVECRLETGRTHQIRVHLAECAKTPILGDPIYGRKSKDPVVGAAGAALGHQALHAARLAFAHPRTGQKLIFERDPPADFTAAVRLLRQR